MRHEKSNWITEYFKSNPLQVTLQIIGVGVLVLNLWLASQLSPLVQDMGLLAQKVEALEKTVHINSLDHVDIQIIKTQVASIKEDVTTIKQDLRFFVGK